MADQYIQSNSDANGMGLFDIALVTAGVLAVAGLVKGGGGQMIKNNIKNSKNVIPLSGSTTKPLALPAAGGSSAERMAAEQGLKARGTVDDVADSIVRDASVVTDASGKTVSISDMGNKARQELASNINDSATIANNSINARVNDLRGQVETMFKDPGVKVNPTPYFPEGKKYVLSQGKVRTPEEANAYRIQKRYDSAGNNRYSDLPNSDGQYWNNPMDNTGTNGYKPSRNKASNVNPNAYEHPGQNTNSDYWNIPGPKRTASETANVKSRWKQRGTDRTKRSSMNAAMNTLRKNIGTGSFTNLGGGG